METSAFLRISDELREATLSLAEEIVKQAQSQSLRDMDEELTASLNRLAENKNVVLVVGEVKGGKSSFINAVIGKNLLPVEEEVATSQAIMISNKPQKSIRLVFTDDSTKKIGEEQLPKYASQKTVDENGGILMLGGKQLSHIEVDYPAHFLPENLTIVDTPGAGTLLSYHIEITQRFISQADAVIYVLDAYKPILQSDLSFLEEILNYTPHVFFIQTKIDIIDEWEAVRERNEELLKKYLKDRLKQPPKVWPISNSQLLKASQQDNPKKAGRYLKISRFEELSNELKRFLYFISGLVKTIETLAGLKVYGKELHAILNGRLSNLSTKSKDELQKKLEDLNHKKQLIKTNWGLEGQGTKEAISQMTTYLTTRKSQFWQLFDDDGITFVTIAERIEQVESIKEGRALSKTLPEEISRTFLMESDKFFREIHHKMSKDYREIAHWLSQQIAPYSYDKETEITDYLEDIFSTSNMFSESAKRSWAQGIKASVQKTIGALFLPTVAIFRVMDRVFKSAEKLERIKRQLLTIARDSLNDIRVKCEVADIEEQETIAPIDNYFHSLQRDWQQKLNKLLQSRGAELDEEIKRLETQVNATKEILEKEFNSAANALKNWQGYQMAIDKYLLTCNEIFQEMISKEN